MFPSLECSKKKFQDPCKRLRVNLRCARFSSGSRTKTGGSTQQAPCRTRNVTDSLLKLPYDILVEQRLATFNGTR